MLALFQKTKTEVVIGYLGKEHMVELADGDGWLELEVILALVKLLLVEPGRVIKDALLVIAIGDHLHFHIKLPARLIAGLDVQDGQLVIQGFLGIKGIKQLKVPKAVTNTTFLGNSARGGAGGSGADGGDGYGGGIAVTGSSSPSLGSSTLIGNIAQGGAGGAGAAGGDGFGGGLYIVSGASANVTDSIITLNLALGGHGKAGGADGEGIGGAVRVKTLRCLSAIFSRARLRDENCLVVSTSTVLLYYLTMPGYVDCIATTGELLDQAVRYHQQGALHQAEPLYRQILQSNPYDADALHLLGYLEHQRGQSDVAVPLIRQAISLSPGAAVFHSNLGVVLAIRGQFEEAARSYDEALRLKPDYPSARWNLSLLRLLRGDFAGGWAEYESRWQLAGWGQSHVDRPLWDGSPLEGKTILLYPEQGLGDIIHFIRYAPMVRERSGTVLLECPPSLAPLLTGVAGVEKVVPAGTTLPAFDVRAPLLSLPGIFGTTLDTIPDRSPYLRADSRLIERWRRELEPLGDFKIAIAWQGSPTHEGDRWRSIPLASFEPLARLDGVRLLSVQKGPGIDQIARLAGRFEVVDLSDRLDQAGAFTDTAAVLKNVDLVVTTDSAIAHLAGALGTPVWVALPLAPDWRWLLERSDSPWYPTMRLFRQARPGGWAELFEQIAEEVCNLTRTIHRP